MAETFYSWTFQYVFGGSASSDTYRITRHRKPGNAWSTWSVERLERDAQGGERWELVKVDSPWRLSAIELLADALVSNVATPNLGRFGWDETSDAYVKLDG